jgi:hypothetical protein
MLTWLALRQTQIPSTGPVTLADTSPEVIHKMTPVGEQVCAAGALSRRLL